MLSAVSAWSIATTVREHKGLPESDMTKPNSGNRAACVIFVEAVSIFRQAGTYFLVHAIFVALKLWNWHLFLEKLESCKLM